MKFVEEGKAVLADGPVKVGAAFAEASRKVALELSSLPPALSSGVADFSQQIDGIVALLNRAASSLDPQAVVAELTRVAQARALPPATGTSSSAVAGEAGSSAEIGAKAVAEPGSGEFSTALAKSELEAREWTSAQVNLLDGVQTHLDVHQAHATLLRQALLELAEIGAEVQALRLGKGSDVLARLQAFRSTTLKNALEHDARFVEASLALEGRIRAALDDSQEHMALWQSQHVACTDEWAVAAKSDAVLADQAVADLESTSLERATPASQCRQEFVAAADAQIDRISDSLKALGPELEELIKAALVPVDLIKQKVQVCSDALLEIPPTLASSVGVVKATLGSLGESAAAGRTKLGSVPDRFQPVAGQIVNSADSITTIKAGVPSQITQVIGILGVAKAELDQASDLCDNAIAICTRYMMRAPLLIPARLLFLGVKTSIPSLKVGVDAAASTAQTAGTTAMDLLDRAVQAVQQLMPVLEQVMARVRAAIDTICSLIQQFEAALLSAGSTLDGLLATVQAAIERVPAQLEVMTAQFETTLKAFMEKVQPEVLIASLQTRLLALKSENPQGPLSRLAMIPTPEALAAVCDRARGSAQQLADVIPKVTEAAQSLGQAVSESHSSLRELLLKALDELDRLQMEQKGITAPLLADIGSWLDQAQDCLMSTALDPKDFNRAVANGQGQT